MILPSVANPVVSMGKVLAINDRIPSEKGVINCAQNPEGEGFVNLFVNLSDSLFDGGQIATRITRIDGSPRLNKQDLGTLFTARTVIDPFRHHE